jgi:curved DNA-binding protein CbpA
MAPQLPATAADDPYATLGVAHDASAAAIRSAFRHIAKAAHPDKGGDAAAFARLKAAAALLLDPEARAVYDQSEVIGWEPASSQAAKGLVPAARDEAREQQAVSSQHAEAPDLSDVWVEDEQEAGSSDQEVQQHFASGGDATLDQHGGLEGALLDLLARQGLVCDAGTQLVSARSNLMFGSW